MSAGLGPHSWPFVVTSPDKSWLNVAAATAVEWAPVQFLQCQLQALTPPPPSWNYCLSPTFCTHQPRRKQATCLGRWAWKLTSQRPLLGKHKRTGHQGQSVTQSSNVLLSLRRGGAFRQDENKPFISVTLTPRDKTNEEAAASTLISPGSHLIASLSPSLASRPHPSIPDTLQAKEPIALAETGNN